MATKKTAKSSSKSKAKPAKAAKAKTRAPVKKTAAKARTAAKPAKKKPAKVPFTPKGHSTATPYLIVGGAAAAIAFYAKAFGAKEILSIGMPGGHVMHAEIKIGDSHLMITDENPAWGSKSPLTLGGAPVSLMVYVKDVDAAFARAVAAGASAVMPPQNMFWGDRYGKVIDPFGHHWGLATHVENVPNKQLQKRADAWVKEMAAAAGKAAGG